MHSRINDVQILLAVDNLLVDESLMHGSHIIIVHFTTNDFNLIPIGFKLHIGNRYTVHLVDDTLVVRSQHLSTISPICLITVILFGVVTGCNVHSCLGTQLTDGKRNFRCRTQALKEINLDAIGREDVCYCFSKQARVVATVVTYHYTQSFLTGESLQYVVGKALCCHTHDVLVHAVGSYAHNAAQTTSTKFQILIESINQRRLVVSFEHCFHFTTSLFIKSRGQPFLGTCFALCYKCCVVVHSLTN